MHTLTQYAHSGLLEVKVIRDFDSGESRGFGFLNFNSVEEAKSLFDSLPSDWEVDGSRLSVSYGTPRKSHSFDWKCSGCQSVNFARRTVCFTCGKAFNPEVDEAATPSSSSTVILPANLMTSTRLKVVGIPPTSTEESLAPCVRRLPRRALNLCLPRNYSESSRPTRGFVCLNYSSHDDALAVLNHLTATPTLFDGARVSAHFVDSNREIRATVYPLEVTDIVLPEGPLPILDNESGYYYDERTGLYFDPTSNLWYSGISQQYFVFDSVTKKFRPSEAPSLPSLPATSIEPSPPQKPTTETVVTSTVSLQPTPSPVRKKKIVTIISSSAPTTVVSTPKRNKVVSVVSSPAVSKFSATPAPSPSPPTAAKSTPRTQANTVISAPPTTPPGRPALASTPSQSASKMMPPPATPPRTDSTPSSPTKTWVGPITQGTICLVCKRQLPNESKLERHCLLSKLHRDNLSVYGLTPDLKRPRLPSDSNQTQEEEERARNRVDLGSSFVNLPGQVDKRPALDYVTVEYRQFKANAMDAFRQRWKNMSD
eukprot:TRINITY_DN2586_c0_g1_i1.p1 TRINITY_DN2586_c0_g1~~TRINITY_DN2586_c0_g1_i1.p1  ORF type:complete len:540 (-),score=109.13 TRINITY_DN2586_c0_g1_i1:16-1635(-)